MPANYFRVKLHAACAASADHESTGQITAHTPHDAVILGVSSITNTVKSQPARRMPDRPRTSKPLSALQNRYTSVSCECIPSGASCFQDEMWILSNYTLAARSIAGP